jgi:cyclopropane-fatty-acyl-phospholipid synthase
MLANFIFGAVIKAGDLTVIDAGGGSHRYGDGSGPPVTIKLHGRKAEWELFRNPKLGVGETYMDGRLTIEAGSLRDFLLICTSNVAVLENIPLISMLDRLAGMVRYLWTINPVHRARRNVAHHYDLSGQLYDLFLDKDRQYSCAYFDHPDQSLEEAQFNKKRHIAAKLLLDDAKLKVLDIGSGWGGLGLYLAETVGAEVTGLTLSSEQHKISNARARRSGLAERVRFELQDYRLAEGTYDRIVSVGMFEHVGPAHFREFFRKAKSLLRPDGVMLLHSIGHYDTPGTTNPWITKYIFPGGYIPALSEVLAAIEKAGLVVADIEILRYHYAETLRHWYQRFHANKDKVLEIYDERFYRMWDFYLTSCEQAFRNSGLMVFQIQLARQMDAVPLQRDYITDAFGRRGRGILSTLHTAIHIYICIAQQNSNGLAARTFYSLIRS